VAPETCRAGRDRGSAIVDFALVGGLLTVLFAALLQLLVVLHVRNVLVDCAAEGARYGALSDQNPAAGATRTRDLITAELNSAYAQDVSVGHRSVDGLDTIEVRVRAPIPAVGLLGVGRVLTVSGHALAEPP
jgi:Flp pilus assembly protein TadG